MRCSWLLPSLCVVLLGFVGCRSACGPGCGPCGDPCGAACNPCCSPTLTISNVTCEPCEKRGCCDWLGRLCGKKSDCDVCSECVVGDPSPEMCCPPGMPWDPGATCCSFDGVMRTGHRDGWSDRTALEAADDRVDALLDRLEAEYGEEPPRDFERGLRSGVRDVYLGGDGRVPAVPPKRYWRDGYRTPEGHGKSEQWFLGYEYGAGAAHGYPYRNVPSSAPRFPARRVTPFPAEDGPVRDAIDPPSFGPVEPEQWEPVPKSDRPTPVPSDSVDPRSPVLPTPNAPRLPAPGTNETARVDPPQWPY